MSNTRVVSQLFSYTEEAIKNQFGSELKMFGMPKPKNDSISKSVKEKKGKSAPSTPVSKMKIKNERDSENMREVYFDFPLKIVVHNTSYLVFIIM